MNELRDLATDIETYVVEMRDNFIVGNLSFDDFDDYVNELEQMGSERCMEIKIDTFEREGN